MLSPIEINQVTQIITNYDDKNKKVPYISDLEDHPTFGPFFVVLDPEDKKEVTELINAYIKSKITAGKTKGSEFFRRFYNLNQDNFRLFRDLNSDKNNIDTEDFQVIGKELQQELFKYENMLTRNMTKRWYALDKVVSAFYDTVHSFLPRFSFVK